MGENVCAGMLCYLLDCPTKKKKTVLEILEVIVHSLLTPLFWGCGVAQRWSPHGVWEAEEGRHKGVRA